MKHDINRWIFEIPLEDVQTGDSSGGNCPCLLCGKEIKNPKITVHLLTTGYLVSTAEPFADSEDQGFHFIGADCAKKLPNNFTFNV